MFALLPQITRCVRASVAHRSLAHLFEAAIFAYMGIDIFSGLGSHDSGRDARANITAAGICANATLQPQQQQAGVCTPGVRSGWDIAAFVAVCVTLVVVSRAVVVPPLCALANRLWMKRRSRIPPASCAAIVAAGLRGAIAFALAKTVNSSHRTNIASATTGVVMFTTFVLGGLTRPLLIRLGLVLDKDENARERIKARDKQAREDAEAEQKRKVAARERDSVELLSSPTKARLRQQLHRVATYLQHLDTDVLQPTFIANEVLEPVFLVPVSARPPPPRPSDAGRNQDAGDSSAGVQLAARGDDRPKPQHRVDSALRALDPSRLPWARAKIQPHEMPCPHASPAKARAPTGV